MCKVEGNENIAIAGDDRSTGRSVLGTCIITNDIAVAQAWVTHTNVTHSKTRARNKIARTRSDTRHCRNEGRIISRLVQITSSIFLGLIDSFAGSGINPSRIYNFSRN